MSGIEAYQLGILIATVVLLLAVSIYVVVEYRRDTREHRYWAEAGRLLDEGHRPIEIVRILDSRERSR